MDIQIISVNQTENFPVTSADFESSIQISAIIHFLHLFNEQWWLSVLKAKCIFVFSLTKDQNPISTIWTVSLYVCRLCRHRLQTQTAKILLQQQQLTGILIQECFEIKGAESGPPYALHSKKIEPIVPVYTSHNCIAVTLCQLSHINSYLQGTHPWPVRILMVSQAS